MTKDGPIENGDSSVPLFGATIFLSAFLLFQVQPLIARHILPWYGGGPGVWTACMLFFQVFLLVGYAYAHLVSAHLTVRRQAIVHASLLLLAIPLASVAPDPSWKPSGGESPTLGILLLLSTKVGFPFALLASTSPLVTRWFSFRWSGRNPYRLYALSNAGSLLALLSYPIVLEPNLRLGTQALLWQATFVVFVFFCVASGWNSRNAIATHPSVKSDDDGPSRDPLWLWITLPATGSVLLIATTSRLSEDIAVTPFLWVLPLSIYLISFIIAFDHKRWYLRQFFHPLFGLSAIGLSAALIFEPDWLPFEALLVMYLLVLFAGTMICHGELVRAKPLPARLTHFYLSIAAGGALGGVFVGLVAPQVFPDYWEYPLCLLVIVLLAIVCQRRTTGKLSTLGWSSAGTVFLLVGSGFFWLSYDVLRDSIESSRSFFGTIHVKPGKTSAGNTRIMVHGHIHHGTQFVEPHLRHVPTGYFGPFSGVGLAIERYRNRFEPDGRGLKIGIIGLGTGTLCTYGQPGDAIRFYEIDPEVERLAREHFTYLTDCKAKVDVAIGDARIVLERELADTSQQFDILVVDAFTSDAIPVHLLTREAVELYHAHLKSEGILAIHASNKHLAVPAIARGAVETLGLHSRRVTDSGDPRYDSSSSHWILASNHLELLEDYDILVAATPWSDLDREPIVWTDDFSSLWTARKKGKEVGKWYRAPNGGRFIVDFATVLRYEDRKHIESILRALYSDSAGTVTLALATFGKQKRVTENSLEKKGTRLYAMMQLSQKVTDRAMLVLIDMEEKRFGVKLGGDWPENISDPLRNTFASALAIGVQDGNVSKSLRDSFEKIDQLIRDSVIISQD